MRPVEYQIEQYKESGEAEAEQQQLQFESKKFNNLILRLQILRIYI